MRLLLQRHTIAFFFILTFLFAWSLWIVAGLFAPALFLPAVLLGAWAPTLSATLLAGATEGKAGLRDFLAKLFRWRVGWVWYGVVLFSMAAIVLAAVTIDVALGGKWPHLTFPPGVPPEAWYIVIPLLFVFNIFVGGPLAEDVGWRGYILPKLGAKVGMLNASLIIGVIWAVWHLPFYFIAQGGQVVGGIPFIWFALLTTAWGVLFAWVFVNTRESILLPVLYHAAINTTLSSTDVLGFEQGSGNLRLLIIFALLTWGVVAAVVLKTGQSLRVMQVDKLPQRESSEIGAS